MAVESWHVARTVRALELLAIKPRSAPELADGLGVHVRTARRVLKRLESEGYVNMSKGRRRRYHPTMRVVALAGQVVDRAELPRTAQPYVTDLREELGLGTHLCVPSYLFALCLVHEAGDGIGCCRPHLRELVPAHCTAAGKALLAWRERWRDAVLEQQLAAYTDRTTIGPESLRRELGRTVARGYAIEDREYQPTTRALGAPVFSESGEAVAAISVVGLVEEVRAERYSEISEAVLRTAAAVSTDLGYQICSEEPDPGERSGPPARATGPPEAPPRRSRG